MDPVQEQTLSRPTGEMLLTGDTVGFAIWWLGNLGTLNVDGTLKPIGSEIPPPPPNSTPIRFEGEGIVEEFDTGVWITV